MRLVLINIAVSILFLASCTDDYRFYEKNIDIPDGQWIRNKVEEFEFEITDTSKVYHIFYNIRNDLDYPFSNLYVQFNLKDSTGKELTKKMHELYLFDPKTGNPSSASTFLIKKRMDDLFDHRFPCVKRCKFKTAGKYTLGIQHFMREYNPISGIQSVGVRIEYAE